ncbi:GtrA family protein [Nocardioides sp. Soil805]|uniref:GtrA family protein n=1 Tax=Nocardioides sp. Soil805 TaxID=1736416 RepID=UPI0007038AF3|nr:GtrA family protein [Nocardioides sp. Soil805]KRF30676.1 polysaccharide synthesis protein GtrA [Nocardioides sp. Soil805]
MSVVARILGRHAHNLVLLTRFGLVGASGVVVNLLVLVALRRLGPHFEDVVVGLPASEFNVRWYHLYSTIAFLVANLWNFQLNRSWTFRSVDHSRWWREYWPFLTVGLAGQALGLVLLTVLLHPGSPLALPRSVLDDTSGLRSRLYWGQLTVIAVVTPLGFVLNKLWTFGAVRAHHRELGDPVRTHDLTGDPDERAR